MSPSPEGGGILPNVGLKQFDRKFGRTLCQELPQSPGVYLFKDEGGSVLYVGKAKNLRHRLQGYRNATRRKAHRKMRILVREATTIEVQPQASERQALLLENELIRMLRPPYNVDGAFFFLYPAVGIWRNGQQTILCFTTDCEAWPSMPFEWYGTFRSRARTKEAFDAMVTLLSFVGHIEGKGTLPRCPRVRGSRVVGIRRLDSTVVDSLHRLWAGESRDALEALALSLLDKTSARRNAGEIQQYLHTIDAFYRREIRSLRATCAAAGRGVGFVAQQERDALFITASG